MKYDKLAQLTEYAEKIGLDVKRCEVAELHNRRGFYNLIKLEIVAQSDKSDAGYEGDALLDEE